MPNLSKIPVSTIVTSTQEEVNVFTFYNENDCLCDIVIKHIEKPDTLQVDIIDQQNVAKNLIAFIEGELYILIKNPLNISWYINNLGELIVKSLDAASYSINDYGELIYNCCDDGEDLYVDLNYVAIGYVE